MNFVYMRVISLLLRMFEKKTRGVVQCDAISIISQSKSDIYHPCQTLISADSEQQDFAFR